MGDEYLVHILGRLSSIQLNLVSPRAVPVFSGPVLVFQFTLGFLVSWVIWMVKPGIFSPWGVPFTLAS